MTILVPSFLNKSSSFLQVEMTTIKAWIMMSLKICQIQQLTTELAALECLKNQFHLFSVAIDPIFLKLADKEGMHDILDVFQFWPEWTTDNIITCP